MARMPTPKPTPEHDRPPRSAPARLRPWMIWLVWMLVIGAMYLLMDRLLAPAPAVQITSANGSAALQLPRHRDGHFYVQGAINGAPVQFMVDTGASLVSVSDALADAARLHGGRQTTFSTANGTRPGRVVRAASLRLGDFTLKNIEIGTGLNMGRGEPALLGQNVLRHFHVTMEGDTMVLRPRQPAP
ncbi:TIGR02281 family clan AA aspartic protease [Vandammella animalimorsus]|uniref:TIGR02281 family clan AA aspartic protease n=2 Tax=Vandammella animalimorsus TaxID=2029117 RepID=A0A2A2AGU9_9BURK|nr:TIGR02281 family clan AA aspartic protease [Vandammella animalimorsus]